jgi:hypothetical protein
MDIIPLVYAKDNRLINDSSELDKAYLIDLDGWFSNQPNLELYQRLSTPLWIDSAPRRFEDVMDVVVAGARRITIKEDTYGDSIQQIFNEIEVEKFLGLQLRNFMERPPEPWNGIVVYVQHRPSFQEEEQLSILASKVPVHLVLKERDLVDLEWAEEIRIKSIIRAI